MLTTIAPLDLAHVTGGTGTATDSPALPSGGTLGGEGVSPMTQTGVGNLGTFNGLGGIGSFGDAGGFGGAGIRDIGGGGGGGKPNPFENPRDSIIY